MELIGVAEVETVAGALILPGSAPADGIRSEAQAAVVRGAP